MRSHALQLSQDRLFAPIARRLGVRVSPLVISFAALLAGATTAALLRYELVFAALMSWLLHRALTGLDGTHARQHGRQSEIGAFVDRIFEIAVSSSVIGVLAMSSPSAASSLLSLLVAVGVNAASRAQLLQFAERRMHGYHARQMAPPFRMPHSLITGVELVLGVGVLIIAPSWRETVAALLAGLFVVDTLLALLWAARRL